MFDTQDWTTVADKREDRQEYSDILDEDTGFSEVCASCSCVCVGWLIARACCFGFALCLNPAKLQVIALQANPESKQQSFMDRFSG